MTKVLATPSLVSSAEGRDWRMPSFACASSASVMSPPEYFVSSASMSFSESTVCAATTEPRTWNTPVRLLKPTPLPIP